MLFPITTNIKKIINLVLSVTTLILAVLANVSCEQQRNDLTQTDGGVCVLSDSGQAKLCIDFPQSISSSQASDICVSQFNSRGGYTGYAYTAGHANTCSNSANQTEVGHCTQSSGIVYRYGSAQWNTTNAQVDCTSLSGTWSLP